MRADLTGTRSKAEILARLQAFAATLPPGAWLLGRGWDQNDWPGQAYPTAADLDAAFPDRPVWLERIDGHAGWANSAALRRATGDLSGTWQPDGGRIVRADTRPTGVFVDAATDLVQKIVPPPDDAYRAEALRRALAATASVGLTGMHDMGTSVADLDLYRRFADEGRFTLRVIAYADGDAAALEQLCRQGPYQHPSGRVRMAGVKFYADGALGSRGHAQGARLRPAGCDARDRRPRQPAGTGRLPRRARRRRRHRSPLAYRARAGGVARGHPALRADGRDRLDATDARDLRHAVGRVAARPRRLDATDARDLRHAVGRVAARPRSSGRRLCVASVRAIRRATRAGLRLPRRVCGSAPRPVRCGDTVGGDGLLCVPVRGHTRDRPLRLLRRKTAEVHCVA